MGKAVFLPFGARLFPRKYVQDVPPSVNGLFWVCGKQSQQNTTHSLLMRENFTWVEGMTFSPTGPSIQLKDP